MAQNVENLMLEQLRLIREDIGSLHVKLSEVDGRLSSDIAELRTELHGQRAILVGLGSYIHQIDERVEHIETKLGA